MAILFLFMIFFWACRRKPDLSGVRHLGRRRAVRFYLLLFRERHNKRITASIPHATRKSFAARAPQILTGYCKQKGIVIF